MESRYIRDDHKGRIEDKMHDILIALVNAIPKAYSTRAGVEDGVKAAMMITGQFLKNKA